MQQTKKIKMADAISPYLAVSCGLRARTWAIIMKSDAIFSEDDSYEISIHVNQMHGALALEVIMHQNIYWHYSVIIVSL